MGIDNRRAGYVAAQHLLKLGVQRLAVLAHTGGAPTVEARIADFREAMLAHGLPLLHHSVVRLDAFTPASVRPLLRTRRTFPASFASTIAPPAN